MDSMFAWCIAAPLIMIALFALVFYVIGVSNTRNMFMTDELEMYGGTIVYQGTSFRVQKGAMIEVRYSGIVVHNPNGTVRAFKTVNPIFSPAPVVTIGDDEEAD